MRIYDSVSAIDWFYHGIMTVDEMATSPYFSPIFDGISVLYDNSCGRVFSWEPLADLASRWCVPNVGEPEDVLAKVIRTMEGDGDLDRVDMKVSDVEAQMSALTSAFDVEVANG